jgi:menaquinone-dependent protoporphyrinogen oxidase
MKSVLVVYGTTEGHTRKIAGFVADVLRMRGLRVDLIDSATPAAGAVQPNYAAAVVAGSLHEHLHQRSLQHFVQQNTGWLNAIPTAFLSVSLAAALSDAESRHQTQHHLQCFLDATGLRPVLSHAVGGALLYTQYDWFKRTMVRMVARQMGADADGTHDHEYTDWDDLQRTVDGFVAAAGLAASGA